MNKKLIFSLIGIIIVSVSIFSVFYEYCTMVTPEPQNLVPHDPTLDAGLTVYPSDYKHCTNIWKDITQQSDVTIEECTKDFNSYYMDAFLNNTPEVTVYTEQNKTSNLAHLKILDYYYDVDYGIMPYGSYLQLHCSLYQN